LRYEIGGRRSLLAAARCSDRRKKQIMRNHSHFAER
jgi:hypothetical protein